ncbi:hypothetical protein ACJQWK_04834 [Exserohilum turcicum]
MERILDHSWSATREKPFCPLFVTLSFTAITFAPVRLYLPVKGGVWEDHGLPHAIGHPDAKSWQGASHVIFAPQEPSLFDMHLSGPPGTRPPPGRISFFL